jgi:hypothetical protein
MKIKDHKRNQVLERVGRNVIGRAWRANKQRVGAEAVSGNRSRNACVDVCEAASRNRSRIACVSVTERRRHVVHVNGR